MDKELLLRYISGEVTDEEKVKVVKWIDTSSENMHEFLALRKLYDITVWQHESKKEQSEKGGSRALPLFAKRIITEALKIAAILVLALMIFKYFNNSSPETYTAIQTLQVPPGQRAAITLTDGSKIWLNANTTFTFPNNFLPQSREVTLNGEGYFVVAHNPTQPFIVKTEKYDIKVWGTEFNVLAYAGNPEFEVSLLDGSVELNEPGDERGIVIKPYQRLFLKEGRLNNAPIEHMGYFQWKDGLISFNDETFIEIVRKLELYFDLKIVVKNDKILKYRCTGKFRSKDGVEHILKVLQLSNKFSYTIDGKLSIITIE